MISLIKSSFGKSEMDFFLKLHEVKHANIAIDINMLKKFFMKCKFTQCAIQKIDEWFYGNR
jgi:hypothetical protein